MRKILLLVAVLLGFAVIAPAMASAQVEPAPPPTTEAPAPVAPTTEAPAPVAPAPTAAPAPAESAAAESAAVTVRHTSTTREVTNLSGRANRSTTQHTWRAYFAGLQVYWYRIDVSWTWNHNRVWDVDSSRQGDGSWGWHYCGSDPAGEIWVGTGHKQRKAYGFGHFGQYPVSPGCILGDRILGGSITVTRHGTAYYRNGTCCD